MASEPRHDFYQTDTSVIVSVYVKGCKSEDVTCSITETSLDLTVNAPSPATSLCISPLFSSVSTSLSSYKVLGSKIEIQLQKANVGVQWKALKGEKITAASLDIKPSTVFAATSSSTAPSTAPRPRSKWDSFKAEDENGKVEDEANIDDFFKKLYADADDDTRRAMMKSYQESGGTALSTNWGEVKKGKVETKPPEGMEAKKY